MFNSTSGSPPEIVVTAYGLGKYLLLSGSAQESILFFATACVKLKKHAGNEIEDVLVQTLDYLGKA